MYLNASRIPTLYLPDKYLIYIKYLDTTRIQTWFLPGQYLIHFKYLNTSKIYTWYLLDKYMIHIKYLDTSRIPSWYLSDIILLWLLAKCLLNHRVEKHAGIWDIFVVNPRQDGHNIQVNLQNTKWQKCCQFYQQWSKIGLKFLLKTSPTCTMIMTMRCFYLEQS